VRRRLPLLTARAAARRLLPAVLLAAACSHAAHSDDPQVAPVQVPGVWAEQTPAGCTFYAVGMGPTAARARLLAAGYLAGSFDRYSHKFCCCPAGPESCWVPEESFEDFWTRSDVRDTLAGAMVDDATRKHTGLTWVRSRLPVERTVELLRLLAARVAPRQAKNVTEQMPDICSEMAKQTPGP